MLFFRFCLWSTGIDSPCHSWHMLGHSSEIDWRRLAGWAWRCTAASCRVKQKTGILSGPVLINLANHGILPKHWTLSFDRATGVPKRSRCARCAASQILPSEQTEAKGHCDLQSTSVRYQSVLGKSMNKLNKLFLPYSYWSSSCSNVTIGAVTWFHWAEAELRAEEEKKQREEVNWYFFQFDEGNEGSIQFKFIFNFCKSRNCQARKQAELEREEQRLQRLGPKTWGDRLVSFRCVERSVSLEFLKNCFASEQKLQKLQSSGSIERKILK